MNEINNNLKFYDNYFGGFQGITERKSATDVALGSLKVVSYMTLVLPIIFGIGYLIAKSKKNTIENLYARVTHFLDNSSKENEPTQDDYIRYLAAKIQDKDYTQFVKAFDKLDASSQGAFFAKTSKAGTMIESIRQIPKEINTIHVRFGDFLNYRNFQKSHDLIESLLRELDHFTKLKSIVIDLRGVAYYSRQVHSYVAYFIKEKSRPAYFNYLGFMCNNSLRNKWSVYNNMGAAVLSVTGLINYFIESRELNEIEIKFEAQNINIMRGADDSKICLCNGAEVWERLPL